MGLDSAIMLDQRAVQLFANSNSRWLPNLVNLQQATMNSSLSECSGVETLLVMDSPQEKYQVRQATSPFIQVLFPRDEHSKNPNTNNPPSFDGNATEIGNINCLSPKSDSACSLYDDDNLPFLGTYPSFGTPNSFIDDRQSPQDHQSNRSRLYSTGSQYTYSPYTPKESEEIADWQLGDANDMLCPRLNRQTSLAIVEEVLGCSDGEQIERIPNIPISPPSSQNSQPTVISPSCEEDSCLPPYPSPSFSAQFNASNEMAHCCNYSDQNLYCSSIKGYVFTDPSAIAQFDDSPKTEENNEATNSSTSQCLTSISDTAATSSSISTIGQFESETQYSKTSTMLCEGQGALIRTESDEVHALINETMQGNSLDVPAMLSDFLDSNIALSCEEVTQSPVQKDSSPIISTAPSPEPSSKQSLERMQNTSEDCPSTSKDSKSDKIQSRRDRNNEACRQSRKRRKEKGIEMGNKVILLTNENAELNKTIVRLEKECEKAKKDIFSAMKIEKN